MRVSDEIREQIKRDYASGFHSHRSLGDKYGVSRTTIARILNPDYVEREREANRIRMQSYEQPKPAYMVSLRFYENDQTLIDKVKSVDNMQQYIKSLIAEDIKKENS